MTDPTDTPEQGRPLPILAEPEPGLAGLPEPLADAMRRRGFEALTQVQRAVLDADAEDRDLRLSSQTGSGKTVAIGLALGSHLCAAPAATTGPSVLVLVPTRELAMQVRDELGWLYAGVRGAAIEVVMGGTSLGGERRALARRPRVVVATPGRALDHLRSGALVCSAVEHVVLDESDRMLDMGFREELEAILEQLPAERRTHLVSATFAAPVRRLADRFQRDVLHVEGTRLGLANQDIEHAAHLLDPRDHYAAIVNLLLLNEGSRTLIFVERRVDVGSLASKLAGDGFAVQPFSGELAQAQRTRTLQSFRDGAIETLVSTDVAARGIDVPDIELVIHADLPKDADGYVHRSGRTGRAGRAGRSVMLVEPRARRKLEWLLKSARIESSWKPAPGADAVRKQLRQRFRRQLHARLAAETPPTQPEIDYAKKLLDGREPAEVVARLLEMAQPDAQREPMEVAAPRPVASPAPGDTRPGFVRFTIDWGERGGAAAKRVLSLVCRRGQLRGHLVGAIEIGPDTTSFEIVASAAARFEKNARRPDPRGPKLRIQRGADGGRSARR